MNTDINELEFIPRTVDNIGKIGGNMSDLEIMIWVLASGFGLMMATNLFMWKNLTSMILRSEDGLNKKIDKLDEKVTDIDRRVCRIEGSLASRDFCGLRNQEQSTKAE